jgi:hypothetical protein
VKSLSRVGAYPVSLPLSAEDIVEFHAARLLLLLNVCGVAGRIDSLTKMAKLDFFVRYPDFFEVARKAILPLEGAATRDRGKSNEVVESAMVRHHYGPWDKRYYHVLAHLESRELIVVAKEGGAYRLMLTDLGRERARALIARPSFAPLVERMKEVKKAFGAKSGAFLKALIYRVFDAEVGRRPLGEVIR